MVRRAIPERSVSAYYVFHSDPWPKKRHHKRRFLQPANVDAMAKTLLDTHHAFVRQPVFGGHEFPLPIDRPLNNFEAEYEVEGRRRHRGSWRRN